MGFKDIVSIIFDESELRGLNDLDKKEDIYQWILEHGMSTKRFLYLDFRGEEGYEIVNFILDYESKYDIELASQKELGQLGEYEYEFLQEKIREVNKIISSKGYGLFSFPTTGDYYALFISILANKKELLQDELLVNENVPLRERYIQLYE